MKFAASLALVGSAALVGASTVSEAGLAKRDACAVGTAGLQAQAAFVYPLYALCKSLLEGNAGGIWGNPSCVAAAIAGSPGLVLDALSCDNSNVPPMEELPSLDYGIYAQIVGSCAYDSTACDITQQNFIDFVYSKIDIESVNAGAVYPSSSAELVSASIEPLMEWTATGDSVPYSNFNDWLHFAPTSA